MGRRTVAGSSEKILTPFRRRVYKALLEVPRGSVISYGELARRIGCGSPQAVGQALKANPFAPRVPCHRVIAADGSLGGFCGSRVGVELVRKRRLLESEGVQFTPDGKVKSIHFATGRVPARQKPRQCTAFSGRDR
ncbi:MAG: MGMT family protein [Kiritimatiellae bacterium]|nr:MGMT family protein [Kiritimatiellia bacterium]